MGHPEQNRRFRSRQAQSVRTPHLASALAVLFLVVLMVVIGQTYAGWLENRYVHALSLQLFPQKRLGTALQRQAFYQQDLLPFYGSSEVELRDPFHVNRVFRMYPTGFTTFPVGGDLSEPISILQKLAAVGRDLAGKKVAISLSPEFFLEAETAPDAYAANFSPLHACEATFSPSLSWELKSAIAKRMLEYPTTLKRSPLIKFALAALADGAPSSLAMYYAIFPLGQAQCSIFGLQDHWETLTYIWQQSTLDPKVVKKERALKWNALLDHAMARYKARATNNPFGFDNAEWSRDGAGWLRAQDTSSDEKFIAALSSSQNWSDLELMLRVTKELGAKPLLLSIPFPGKYYNFIGVSLGARQKYYERMEALAARYGVDQADFQDHDNDQYFFLNPGGHLSSVGWIYYSEELDAFYHNDTSSLLPGGIKLIQ